MHKSYKLCSGALNLASLTPLPLLIAISSHTPYANCNWQGMKYIHESPLGSHGNLKSNCCLIDSRWMLKISGFGLQWLRAQGDNETFSEYKGERVYD